MREHGEYEARHHAMGQMSGNIKYSEIEHEHKYINVYNIFSPR